MKHLLEQLTRAADLPDEAIPGLPLVEIAGDRRVLIEHHLGVTQYSSCQICIKVKFGHICVSGQCLVMTRMVADQLIITGRIDNVSIFRG